MSEKLKNELQKRLDAARLDPASLRDAKQSRELLALVADERGRIRDDAAAALEQMRGEGVAMAAYEQGIRLAVGGSYAYDGKIGQDEIEALAMMGKVRFEEEATISDPSVGSISTRPYLRSESDIASTNESLAGFIGGLDRAKWSKEAVAFMDRALALLAGRANKKAVQAMQREVSSDFSADYSKRKDDGDLGAATRLAIFRRLMRFSLQSSPAAAPAETVRRPEAPIFAGLTGASWEEHASDTVYTASYRAMMLYVESCRTDRAKLEAALTAIDAEIGSGWIKNEYLAQAMRGTRAEIVKILDEIKSGRLVASDKPLEAIPAGSILSGLHGIVWESDASDSVIIGAEISMDSWIDAYKVHPNKLHEAYALLEREIRSGRAKNDRMRGAMGSAKARIAEMIADPSKAVDTPFVVPTPLPVPPPARLDFVPPVSREEIQQATDIRRRLGASKGAGTTPTQPSATEGIRDPRVTSLLANMPKRETLNEAVERSLQQLESFIDEFDRTKVDYDTAKRCLDGWMRSNQLGHVQKFALSIIDESIPLHRNPASRKALEQVREELVKKPRSKKK